MHRKGQILIIILWILVILTVLAVTLGHRVSLGLKMSSFHNDGFQGLVLAKTGLTRAVDELNKDKNKYDSLNESWANNESAFARIVPAETTKGFASVGYTQVEGLEKTTVRGVIDEERKININTAPREVLAALLENYGIPDPAQTAYNILIWRGEIQDTGKVYDELGYKAKGQLFQTVEELKLVKGIPVEAYGRLKDVITVYGAGMYNINTVSREVLYILCRGIAARASINTSLADGVVEKIIQAREAKIFWADKNDISLGLTGSEEQNIFNRLMDLATCASDNFLIEATGNIGKIKKSVIAVYNRKKNEILYWHEN